MHKEILNKEQSYFLSLMRISACIGSFIVHFGQVNYLTGTIRELTDLGALGVCMFFILSGFFGAMKFDINNNVRIIEYYLQRFIRILPLYYFWLLIYFVMYIFIKHNLPLDEYHLGIWRYILLLNDKIGGTYFWTNIGGTWSVNYFLTFYLLMPFIAKIINSYKKSIFVIAFGILCIFLYNKVTDPHFLFMRYAIFFFVGILVYYALKESKLNETAIVSLLMFFIMTRIINSRGFHFYFVLFVGILCIGLQINLLKYSFFNRIYNQTRVIDKYTYTFYLTHCFLIYLWRWLNLNNRVLISLLMICGSIIATFIVYNFIELPIKKYIKSKVKY